MHVHVKVACVQMAPVLGQPQESMAIASRLLEPYTVDSELHVVLLPEMAFSGYTFRDRAAIRPCLEDAAEGPTAEWCQLQARRLRCSVVCGFPRRVVDVRAYLERGDERCFNSMMVVGPDGALVTVYDKHHLYCTDETWADEGAGFASIELPNLPGIRVGLGICMDINPYQFKAADMTAPFTDYEFANFHKQAGTQLILFASAWCNSHPDDPLHIKLTEPDIEDTLNYWVHRLKPLLGRDVCFVVADRVGAESCEPVDREGSIMFCGGSCCIDMKGTRLVGRYLDAKVEEVLIVQVPIEPLAAADPPVDRQEESVAAAVR